MAQSKQRVGKTRAFFLDRDGVLIEEADLLTDSAQLRILPGVVEALRKIESEGYSTVVVTNQTVVARGLITEKRLEEIHDQLRRELERKGGPPLSAIYICPHHPHADVPRYRVDCDCRKPKAGLLLRASDELDIDLARSFMVGDRPSDIAAGKRAGCTTVLVESGAHLADPIVGMDGDFPEPDVLAPDLRAAVDMIFGGEP